MPVVLRHRGLSYYFFSNEGQPPEPPHVHVRGGGRDAKVWLEPTVFFADSYGFNPRELSNILSLGRYRKSGNSSYERGMTISATKVHFDEHTMTVDLTDGRALRVPLAWFPRLLNATPTERTQVEISRVGLHWEQLDEDISIAGLLAGRGDVTRQARARSGEIREPPMVRRSGTDKRIYVERRAEGDYAVRRANAERASDVLPTQREAIERARELSPGSRPHVERVRKTTASSDKWRKA